MGIWSVLQLGLGEVALFPNENAPGSCTFSA